MTKHRAYPLFALLGLFGLTGCPTLPTTSRSPAPSLVLAYVASDTGSGTPRIRIRESEDGLLWRESAGWPAATDQQAVRGVGLAVEPQQGLESLLAWGAGGANTRVRYGLAGAWETGFGQQAQGGADAAPSAMALTAGSWVLAQRQGGVARAHRYWPDGQRWEPMTDLIPGNASAIRQRPAMARDANHFAIAAPAAGTSGTPAVWMVVGTVANGNPAPSSPQTLVPILSRPPQSGVLRPLIDVIKPIAQLGTATDTCLASDGRGHFLLGVLESPARLEPTTQLLAPTDGEQVLRTFVARGADFPGAAGQGLVFWTPWSASTIAADVRLDHLQCAFKPSSGSASNLEALVLAMGDRGPMGWSVAWPTTTTPEAKRFNGANQLNPVLAPSALATPLPASAVRGAFDGFPRATPFGLALKRSATAPP